LCQNRTFGASGSPVLYASAPKALKISESFNTASGSPAAMVRHVDAVGEITEHLHVVLARLSHTVGNLYDRARYQTLPARGF
jgi:hypothetical protein